MYLDYSYWNERDVPGLSASGMSEMHLDYLLVE